MKRVLVTGAGSYIGTSFCDYAQRFDGAYAVDMLSLRDDRWKETDFSRYDVILHTAGIAHIKETARNAPLYYKINRDLAVETAEKAKAEGVRQFVFLSSASVYGMDEGVITSKTVPSPKSHYGKSKLQAEERILKLRSERFVVTILRPPMVYGEGCKGNYQMLVKIAERLPLFADYQNQRSLIHIDALSCFICKVIDEGLGGLYFPQDAEYSCTCRMIQRIALERGKRLRLLKGLNPIVWLLKRTTPQGKKAFGDLIYLKDTPFEGVP